ncbi:hypothetical protein WG922_21505 [Ramlibacter sp. AN1015]|uniref:hypothetical protein n=1 Tax=Ramlibacter sp. AN1015 TaxID=3133428 RepID=UPI0030C54095
MDTVAQIVKSMGKATIAQIVEIAPHMTQAQASKAARNAVAKGMIHSLGQRGGRHTAMFAPGPGEAFLRRMERKAAGGVLVEPRNEWAHGRPASVWDFGQGVSR